MRFEIVSKYETHYLPRKRGGHSLNHVLRGKIAYLKMVLGEASPMFRKAAKKYNSLSKHNTISITPIEEINPYPLRGPSPGNAWSFWFARYKDGIVFLEPKNELGDPLTATAFHIGNSTLATALHNLKYQKLAAYLGDDQLTIQHSYPPQSETAPDVGILTVDPDPLSTHAWLPTQLRLPQVGEEVAAIGFPAIPQRDPTLVMHVGIVEALPMSYITKLRFIQVSFQTGGGLSGAPLIDKRGFVVGVMIENVFLQHHTSGTSDSAQQGTSIPARPYGQAVPIEYLWDIMPTTHTD